MNNIMLNKCEDLKEVIRKLYCEEGKSKEYIRTLLGITRGPLDQKIKEWGFVIGNNSITPSTQKFVNQYKELIVSMLRNDKPLTEIADKIGVSKDKLWYVVRSVPELAKERNERDKRIHDKFLAREQEQSHLQYITEYYDNETWKSILGYSRYEVSNYGRIRVYTKKYDQYYLIPATPNPVSGRMYVDLTDDKGKHHKLLLHRLVAFAFCDGYSEEKNTVNHKDGDVTNNHCDNLEWTSQSENNKHAYDVLNRQVNIAKKLPYKIVYKNKYSFKTIAAFARFIGKAETTARRWIDEPDKHDIKLVA